MSKLNVFPSRSFAALAKKALLAVVIAGGSVAFAEPIRLPVDKSKWQLPRWATNVSIVKDGINGADCFKIATPKRDWSQQIRTPIFFSQDVARIVFSGRMKTQNVTGGAAAIEKCRAQLVFLDSAGDRVGHWPQTTDVDGTTDWKEFKQEHNCPPNTRVIEVWLGMYLSTGTAWFDDLQLTAYDASGNELTPEKRAVTETTDTTGWTAFEPGLEDTSRPLVVDFSKFIPAPAGKFGFVQAKDGHFVFENGQRARFWGVGYVKKWDPPKEEAPAIAEALARAGINLVRFHGMDAQNPKDTIFDITRPTTDRLDPAKMDRLDFFINELKQRGIYCNLNLTTKRRFTEADGVKDAALLPQGGKAASMFDRRLIELQKDYARLLMTHVNPYTNLAYKDDPAVAMLEIMNETSLNMLEFLGGTPASYEADLDRLFSEWCDNQKIDRPKGHVKSLIKVREGTIERFIEHVSREYYQEIFKYLREELKIVVPISGTQFDVSVGEKRVQAELDYVDHHAYWDHPAGGWDPQSIYVNKPMVKLTADKGTLIESLVQERVAGRPYSVSEWNFAWPNDFIGEGPLLISAYSGFNDWDAPMVFGTDGLKWSAAMGDTFNHASKPHFMLPLMTSAIAFYRGDVTPGPVAQVDIRKSKAAWKLGGLFTREQLLTMRCELVTSGKKATEAQLPATRPAELPEKFTSADGQIEWASAGKFVLNTPRTQAVLGFTSSEPVKTKDATITIRNPFAQVILTSLTDEPIGSTDRLLICATARAENSGQTYRTFRKGLASLGSGPILMEPVNATVNLSRDRAKTPTVYVVDAYGRRTEKTVPMVYDDAAKSWQISFSETPAGWLEVVFNEPRTQ